MAGKKKGFAFEQSLKELETVVRELESGDLPLEQALVAFEKGIGLTRECQKALEEAEQKVRILLEKDGKVETQPFNPADSAD
ncbi:exodeoxyribonuclease VII small subunit [Sansalvadorimonas sp. 2012CJ34-2]|uniref:Exodeoxyribonuclease 7 small subunit n=1 Tax=Parendozoicomonas callyspongiae TaxID=2942213 RepID=A0ABT0PL28_9GAMM|nr:exodeoxyribonuclease VII small subunit [Sansalvadorimonas sp. 2012CJ34-2]MCL6272073.1 exodeoxyribonuclease VII small subunit [Sansalvadorimonas sp. 2012CJ34-2]